jgi:hypothetical protein
VILPPSVFPGFSYCTPNSVFQMGVLKVFSRTDITEVSNGGEVFEGGVARYGSYKNFFHSTFTNVLNKLECLSLESLSSVV